MMRISDPRQAASSATHCGRVAFIYPKDGALVVTPLRPAAPPYVAATPGDAAETVLERIMRLAAPQTHGATGANARSDRCRTNRPEVISNSGPQTGCPVSELAGVRFRRSSNGTTPYFINRHTPTAQTYPVHRNAPPRSVSCQTATVYWKKWTGWDSDPRPLRDCSLRSVSASSKPG